MKKIKIVIILALLALIFYIINSIFKTQEYFEIVAKTNGGVPSEWEYQIEDTNLVKYIDTKYDNKTDNDGGPVDVHFKFKALKEGKTKIVLIYRNTLNNQIEKINNYEIIIDKNLNIKIKE